MLYLQLVNNLQMHLLITNCPVFTFTQYHWERRIAQLGGPNYSRYGPKMFDNEGKEVPGTRGKLTARYLIRETENLI